MQAVAAQLLNALSNDNYALAHAAASELAATDSDYLFRVLAFAWWLSPSDHPLQGARAAAFVARDPHGLYSALIHAPYVLPPISTPAASHKPLQEMKKAIKKRQTAKVFAAALAFKQDELVALGIAPAYLQAAAETIYKPLEYRILEHACAALTAFSSRAAPAPPWTNVPAGARAGRTFVLEDAALHTWGVKKAAAADLRGDPLRLLTTTATVFETEEDEIAFYETHFPDDIPDEWPDEEVAKSHGILVDNGAVASVWRIAFLDLFG